MFLIFVGRRRINGLGNHFFATGEARKERRGGRRNKNLQEQVERSVIDFISKFRVVQSHYGRRNTVKTVP